MTEDDLQVWAEFTEKLSEMPFVPPVEEIELSKTLDLHGKTVQAAYLEFLDFVRAHSVNKSISIKIITGKSGVIRDEFETWCDRLACLKRLDPVVDRSGEIGSWKIWLKTS